MAKIQRIVREKRREVVQREALRGKSTRQIEATFARAARKRPVEAEQFGMVNPDTGKAWDHTTIARDLTYLERQWRAAAREERERHKARQLAELRELRKAAWQADDFSEVRLCLRLEVDLMGTKEMEETIGATVDVKDLSDDQLEQLASGESLRNVLASSGGGGA